MVQRRQVGMTVFELVAVDLSELSTPEIFRSLHSQLGRAQKAAWLHYTRTCYPIRDSGKIGWLKKGQRTWTSGALLWVMYNIREITVK